MTGNQILAAIGMVCFTAFLITLTFCASRSARSSAPRQSRPRPSGQPPQWKQGGSQ